MCHFILVKKVFHSYFIAPATLPNFSEPVIFHKLGLLYLASHQRIVKFPKPSRHSLGIRIENSILEILELSYLAVSKKGVSRLLILNKIDVKLKILGAHLRLAYKIKNLNDAGFSEIAEKTVEIGKIIGGWIKNTKAQDKNA